MTLCTVWLLPATHASKSFSAALAAGSIALAGGLTRLPWERWPTRALIAFPAVGFAVLAVTALLTKGITPAYGGYFTVGFVYLGLTQSRRHYARHGPSDTGVDSLPWRFDANRG